MTSELFCHTCEENVEEIEASGNDAPLYDYRKHKGHAIEPVGYGPPTIPAKRRVFVAYNVWDSEIAWALSLRSVSTQVDGVIAVVGPYKGWVDTRPPDEIAMEMRDTLQANIPKGLPVDWIYKSVWESQIDKRNAYLNSELLRPGDYILILDDDEILLTKDRGTLRSIMMFAMERAINLKVNRPEVKIATTLEMSVGEILKKYRSDPYAGHHLSIEVTQRGYRSEVDAVFATRLIAWVPGLQYWRNHFTLVEPDGEGGFRQVVPTLKLWAIIVGHVPHLRSLDRRYKRIHFYIDREADKALKEGDRPDHFGREL